MIDKSYCAWICCQIGAREHYAVPRTLHKTKHLIYLITDAWVSPSSAINRFPKGILSNLRERFHGDLSDAPVNSFTISLAKLELLQKIKKTTSWEHIIARNEWFQEHVIHFLKQSESKLNQLPLKPTIFSYSYAALEIFRYAKTQGWYTVLGQIDPGIVEEKLVAKENSRCLNYESNWQPAPPIYWEKWQEECLLADRIIVNSSWSQEALEKVGIPNNKMEIIPLAYEAPKETSRFQRVYPSMFSFERPLRVLFLGQIILRKGIAALLEAADILRDQPIEFWLVGSQGIANIPTSSQFKYFGTVSRSSTSKYYQLADVFLFPTLSDGFGITQLEAQVWKLPIIASRFCGDVVKDGINGLLLNEVTGESIAQALLFCLQNPQNLQIFSQKIIDMNNFSLVHLNERLQSL